MDRRRFLSALGAGAGFAAVGLPISGCAAAGTGSARRRTVRRPHPTPGRDRWARVPSVLNRRVTAEQATTC